ncbi:uncharacterized protein PHACADRAFT_200857 [Phanerochaete carnosa HHB-10118-sp]|uniref:Peptidase A1 domain-containing protein n=1 Tax=Phanerochaete carnosa (strain HHB-10118-sp) TaxID=650164 RepID=K5UK79_PHACS|nr:uncharacterized protein PHACADRAFT_200857 [Phanerochaete carnosa HHB-10118-sp]EKM50006.1 hypothetical protein PHACADRAFT_200857 [Phanerochaete carnosa HHB-10118-sp]
MFSQLFVAVYLALFAGATPLTVRSPPMTISLARHLNSTGSRTVLELDQMRMEFLKQSATRKGPKSASSDTAASIPVTNGIISYFAEVQVGYPPTNFSLIVDTGSSNTWVGGNPGNPYTPTSTSHDTGMEVFVEYGTGLFEGEEFIDQVSLAEGLLIQNQSIGVAGFALGFSNTTDGVMGIGPTDLTSDTIEIGELVPTLLDNAFAQGLIDEKKIGIFLKPTNNESVTTGEITFGSIDRSKLTSDIHFVNITSTFPANMSIGVNQSIAYGNTPILNNSAGIMDTGTTLILLATDAFNMYQQLTGAVLDESTGLLTITPAQYDNLQSLFFTIGGCTFEFNSNAQIWPRGLNAAINGVANMIYLVIGDSGSGSGSEGLSFLNGQVFLERFFLAFDAENSRVGLATTRFTNATTN